VPAESGEAETMTEVLAVMLFWFFLFGATCALLAYGWQREDYVFSITGTLLAVVLAIYSMSLPMENEATIWVMVGLGYSLTIIGILSVLGNLPQVFDKIVGR
jgi:heme O synthase-like polyprenyltransferase